MHTEPPTGSDTYLGIDFARLPLEPLAGELLRLSEQDRFCYVVTPNVDHVVQLHKGEDPSVKETFRAAYSAAVLRICDSRILQLFASWQGKDLVVVPGSDLTAFLFESGLLDGRKVALIGGGKDTVALLKARYSAVSVSQYVPPMGLLRDEAAQEALVQFVRDSDCEVTLFAVGSPQSEIVALKCMQDGGARGIALCIGASVEFITGERARAPSWMQIARLEWLFRLLSEPRRLWRRYLVIGPKFFRLAWTFGRDQQAAVRADFETAVRLSGRHPFPSEPKKRGPR